MDPIFEADLATMKRREKEKSDALRKFMHFWKNGYPEPIRKLRQDLGPTGGHDWLALSASARTEAATLILEDLSSATKAERRELSLVSSLLFASKEWCMPLERASLISFEAIREEVNRTLAGQNYVGTIESGLYRDRKMRGAINKGVVSWHVHLFWIGHETQSLDAAIERFNSRHTSPLEGAPAADWMPRSWDTVGARVTYMLKTPAKTYAATYFSNYVDPGTGVISGRDVQWSRRIRPGEQVKQLNLVAEAYLDDLMIVGGRGWDWVASLQAAILRNRGGWMERYGEDEGLRGGLVREVPGAPNTNHQA